MTLVCHNQRLNGSLFTRWTESSLSDYLWIKHLSLGGGGRAGAILFSQVNFFYALPQFPAEKNVILPLVWPKIVMSLPTLKDMTGVIKRDQFLPSDEGRRQCDIQEQVSKITSRIDKILSTNNPGAAGKFYTTDYVLVPADQLILWVNIMKLSELLENISDMDWRIKAPLNTLFHSRTGNLIRGEEYSNRLMKMLLQGLMKLKKRVNSELKYLNEKLDQCKDMIRGVLLLKNKIIKKKITETTKGRTKKETTERK